MSVFTTRSLMHALGVSRGTSASSAVAVNWVIKVSILVSVLSSKTSSEAIDSLKYELSCSIYWRNFTPE